MKYDLLKQVEIKLYRIIFLQRFFIFTLPLLLWIEGNVYIFFSPVVSVKKSCHVYRFVQIRQNQRKIRSRGIWRNEADTIAK